MTEEDKRILIIEDEIKIAEAVAAYLQNAGYETVIKTDGLKGMEAFENSGFDLVILDLMLPLLSGEEICKKIRKTSRTPIIMLTAKIEEEEKISGLNIGADDYITKPFSPRELVARVNSIFRRTSESNIPLFQQMSWNNGDLEVDFDQYIVKKAGETISLTPNEFKLLRAMIKYPKKIFTREELIEIAFGQDFDGYERTIDSHIKNLRSKIESDTASPKYIVTVRGVGYKFGEVD